MPAFVPAGNARQMPAFPLNRPGGLPGRCTCTKPSPPRRVCGQISRHYTIPVRNSAFARVPPNWRIPMPPRASLLTPQVPTQSAANSTTPQYDATSFHQASNRQATNMCPEDSKPGEDYKRLGIPKPLPCRRGDTCANEGRRAFRTEGCLKPQRPGKRRTQPRPGRISLNGFIDINCRETGQRGRLLPGHARYVRSRAAAPTCR